MKSIAAALVFLLLFYSHALADSAQPQLPGDLAINKEAGCGGHLSVTVRLQSGQALLFDVDTGSPFTIFDESLKSKLGKRVGTGRLSDWGVKMNCGVFAAPKLYLGDTLLTTGTNILVCDLKKLFSSHRPMGILGMDCLKHYCIQMDFAAGKMRFLNAALMDTNKPGQTFPLVYSSIGQSSTNFFRVFIHHTALVGGKGTNLLVDTGLDTDGALEPEIFEEESDVKGQGIRKLEKTMSYFPKCAWNGETYTNVIINEAASIVAGKGANVIGLRFLARHLVTFDFPNRVMYLQPQSIGPLPNDSFLQDEALVNSLVIVGDKLPADINARLNAMLDKAPPPFWFRWFGGKIIIKRDENPMIFYYGVSRESKHTPWTLKKAWCTDQKGHIVRTYLIPH